MIYSVGSIFLDHIIKINSFPKKPIKLFAEGIEKRLGGSAAVASFTIKKLGIDSSFIGRLGDDDVSKYLKGELSAFKIKHNDIITIKGANHLKVMFMKTSMEKGFSRPLMKKNYLIIKNYQKFRLRKIQLL